MASVPKKAANLTVRLDLLEQARELNINLSQEFEQHLAEVVRQRRADKWREANRDAIEAYNRHIERDGLWSDGIRSF
ncbi:type II toxin-antitoxin system CcdA family antitoxin [Frateuria sp. STR12]|uniref:type II toxin-antitoxin system CcdA family antitoxin n=1 Tax=Frateuria hangzhouensis TaxID=2995589 RepID=UPI002260E136|nr:type II toxin-antitoxin system CcdA family antitoxin [Frateuria sp. STR12]MCX7514579.1 type II toxin-antitoxin system CcdA family antitoxin [Frateuria sp. STR12]